MRRDTVLFTVPSLHIILTMEQAIKRGDEIRPLTGIKLTDVQQQTKLNGPLYRVGTTDYYVTAEELSWALRQRYITSEFYGETVEFVNGVEELLKPRVRYVGTPKGIDQKRWY